MKRMVDPRTFVFNALIGTVLIAAVALFNVARVPQPYVLLAVSVMAVVAIIFGEKLEQISLVRRVLRASSAETEGWRKIVESVTAREAMIPVMVILGCMIFGYVSMSALETAATEKAQIIFLILTFAVIAYGIKQSGYFRYAAFRVLEVCDGNMTRMILYLFLLSSVLTYVTSNDIVILVMTPIILELCRQSQIGNARLLLLGQFVAANTLSMGLLIGSPTNIIVGLDAGIDFIDYFLLMAVPTALAVVVSFLVMHLINEVLYKWIARFVQLSWDHDEHYVMPALMEQPGFSREMGFWVAFFACVVIAVALVSQLERSFFWISVPAFLFALIAVYWTRDANSARGGDRISRGRWNAVVDCVGSLPYSIVLFAMVFFAIAESLAATLPFDAIFVWLDSLPLSASVLTTMGGVAGLVNTVNDLPASAIIGEGIQLLPDGNALERTIFLQSTLAALNIACYITPIGALAGIIWFHIMDRETAGTGIRTPSRLGMLVYGSVHFAMTAAVLAVLIPMMNIVFHWMVDHGDENFRDLSGVEVTITVASGIVILVGVGLFATNICKRHRVFVGDMRAFLTAASWLQVRSQTGGWLVQLLIIALVVLLFGVVIWWIERGSVPTTPDFVVWVLVVLGSGHFEDWFPSSPLGRAVAGLLPLVAIFVIIYLYRATQRAAPLEETSRRIARGEIVTRRSVILGYEAWMRDFVEGIWNNSDNAIFQTILYTEQLPPVTWTEERDYSAIYAREISMGQDENLRVIVDEYRLERADEVYLLGERFAGSHGAGRIAIILDEIAVNLRTLPSAELGRKRFAAIDQGEDPEEHAGRLPRIFIWDDADVSQISDHQMHRLLVKLPAQWRDNPDRAARLAPLVNTAAEKSWMKRRSQLFEHTAS